MLTTGIPSFSILILWLSISNLPGVVVGVEVGVGVGVRVGVRVGVGVGVGVGFGVGVGVAVGVGVGVNVGVGVICSGCCWQPTASTSGNNTSIIASRRISGVFTYNSSLSVRL